MLPIRARNATRVLAETQDEYFALAIRDETVNGVNQMTSIWEPSPAELKELIGGGTIKLTILGNAHPPVMVGTQPAAK